MADEKTTNTRLMRDKFHSHKKTYMEYQILLSENGTEITINTEPKQTIRVGDMVYQEDLPKWGPKKVKKFFYPDNSSDVIYVQFDEGYGCNDGCLPVINITKRNPNT